MIKKLAINLIIFWVFILIAGFLFVNKAQAVYIYSQPDDTQTYQVSGYIDGGYLNYFFIGNDLEGTYSNFRVRIKNYNTQVCNSQNTGRIAQNAIGSYFSDFACPNDLGNNTKEYVFNNITFTLGQNYYFVFNSNPTWGNIFFGKNTTSSDIHKWFWNWTSTNFALYTQISAGTPILNNLIIDFPPNATINYSDFTNFVIIANTTAPENFILDLGYTLATDNTFNNIIDAGVNSWQVLNGTATTTFYLPKNLGLSIEHLNQTLYLKIDAWAVYGINTVSLGTEQTAFMLAGYNNIFFNNENFYISTLPTGEATTTTYLTCNPDNGFISYSLCNLLGFVFVPMPASVQKFSALLVNAGVQNKPPFGIISAISEVFNNLNASTTPIYNIDARIGDIDFFQSLKTIIATILWLALIFYIFRRIIHFEL